MATSLKSNSKPKTTVKNPRKKLSIAEQRAKIESARAKLAAQESKLAVSEMKEFIKNLKVQTVGDLFKVALAQKKDVKKVDVLRTLAVIGDLKVTITEKPKLVRKMKVVKPSLI
jgi:hypothetical protein